MRKFLTICATGGKRWIGGLYYKKNIAFSLMNSPEILKKYKITLITEKVNKDDFSFLEGVFNVKYINYKYQKERKFKEFLITIFSRTDYLFGSDEIKSGMLRKFQKINWIPDFQHYYYSEFFDESELEKRKNRDAMCAMTDNPMVLSSNDCKRDFIKFCKGREKQIYVVPFVSFIENEIKSMTTQFVNIVLKKFKLQGERYVCVSNQFWQHKNHIVVLKAIKLLSEKYPEKDLKFVFTGYLKDCKNEDYYNSLMELYEDKDVKSRCRILGFLDRMEQLAVMKKATFLIQPSLFEGWGTVVEDGKVLDKLMLISDIPVHREQMSKNCILFNPNDSEELLEKILYAEELDHDEDVDKGIADMYARAKEYSKEFQRLLEDYSEKER